LKHESWALVFNQFAYSKVIVVAEIRSLFSSNLRVPPNLLLTKIFNKVISALKKNK
jgi:hypothetical protein